MSLYRLDSSNKSCQSSLLVLILLPLLSPAAGQTLASQQQHLCDGDEFRAILKDIDSPACLAEKDRMGAEAAEQPRNCSLMHQFERLAKQQGKSLDTFMSRVSVMIFAHSEFIQDMTVPFNPTLEVAAEVERQNAFLGVTKCLKSPNSVCQRLRVACAGGFVSHFVFLISGHCSKNFGCSMIESKDKQQPTAVLNMLQYIHFRLLERQTYIAKELGEMQLSTSISTEYLIQSDMDDAQGKQLVSADSRPVVVFSAGPVKNLAYYQQLAWFLDAALGLRHQFVFHLIATPLSLIEHESERPLYRWKIREHQSFLAMYTKELCSSDTQWVFNCKPLMKIANEALIPEQYLSFILHGALSAKSMPGTAHLTLKTASQELKLFVRLTASYVLSVMPAEELLTDPRINHEMLQTLVSYLSSSFSISYVPLMITKATALQVLEDLNTGLDLEEALERPSFFIRMPNGACIVLKNDEPIATIDRTVRDVSKEGVYQVMLQSAREIFNSPYMMELPEKMTRYGHMAGEVVRADDETKDLVDEIRTKNRTDAFVEQLHFMDVYNVTGVLVIESDANLLSDFFNLAGKDKPWLVLFTVSWSPLCKAARAIWASVGECAKRMGFPDVQLVKVDCFEANEICQKLGVTSYPTVAMFSRGIEMNTYSGPIVTDELCLYVKLAFEPPVISSSSEQETQQILSKSLALKHRAFVFRGAEMPSQLTLFAKAHRFRELFIHEKQNVAYQLTAVHRDVKPDVAAYMGSLDDAKSLAEYVENNHLDSVFPCTWMYLPSALKRECTLAILFELDDHKDESASLLEHLRAKFTGRATICYLNLRRFAHLNDLVHRLAGLNLPALVVLTKPPGATSKLIHRLPLGGLAISHRLSHTADWLEKAVSNRLTDGKPVEPQQPWQPATRVFNFVKQVYHGQTDSARTRTHSSRAFTAESDASVGPHEEDEAKPIADGLISADAKTLMDKAMPQQSMAKDEL